MKTETESETIDMTPSWEQTALMLVAILEGGGDTAWARGEIIRMGKIIDRLKSQQEVTA